MMNDDVVAQGLSDAFASLEDAEAQAAKGQDLLRRKNELHSYLKEWQAKAMSHRRANYEDKWNRWRRNASSIYDPAKKARKESWQSTVFIPISLQNKEIIKSNLHRTLISGLPYNVKPRPSGDEDQGRSIKDLTIREMQRSRFELVANDVLDDVTTYGTGFFKRVWVKTTQKRRVRAPRYDTSYEAIARAEQMGVPLEPVGYDSVAEDREVYRGVKAWFVSIWDIFLPEGAADIKETSVSHRVQVRYQDIVDGVNRGYYFPESAAALRNIEEDESQPKQDQQAKASDEALASIPTPKTAYSKKHTLYEFWGLLPSKWVYLKPEDQALIEDPEQLIPAKALFCPEALLSCDENESYDGLPPFEAPTYIHKPGSVYGMGPLEMIEQVQDDINETSNQRKDNVNIILNRMFAILEQGIVSKADLVSRPGGGIRIKKGATDDVRKALMWQETPDVTRSSYIETDNDERFAQELTGATRVTIGSGGSYARDVTQTKGGMEILRTSANERFTYYAMLIEQSFVSQAIRAYYTLVYDNIEPADIVNILGPERAVRFRLMSPDEVDRDYHWAPEGVFSTMHQPIRIAQWQAFRDQYRDSIFFNDYGMAETLARAIELPNEDRILVPLRDPQTGEVFDFAEIQQAKIMAAAQAARGAALQGGAPGVRGSPETKPRIPVRKPGQNATSEVL